MRCSGFVVLRTPLLPFDTLTDWARGVEAAAAWQASEDTLAEALRGDGALLRARLTALVLQPEIKEAIALASPAMAEVLRDPTSEQFRRAEATFARYVLRMSARPTPFGLMAGISAGDVGSETRLELAPRAQYRRRTSLDGATIAALGEALVRDPRIRRELVFRPNPDPYEHAGELRYFMAAASDARSFRFTAIERSAWVDAAIARSTAGARRSQIASAIRSRGGKRATKLVDAMIDARVLLADVEAPVTGDEPLADVTRTLRSGGVACHAVAAKLELVRKTLNEVDSAPGLVAPPELDARARQVVQGLAPAGARPPFQADLSKPAPGLCLDSGVVDEVLAAVRVLHQIRAPSRDAGDLHHFRAEYQRRYGARQVRLVDALDPEYGIGFQTAATETTWSATDDVRLELLRRAWAERASEIVLSPHDIRALSRGEQGEHDSTESLPDALAALVTLGAASDAALRCGDFRVLLHSVDGPSGARLLGRACSIDPVIHARVAAHLREEERLRPSVSFVEVLVLPKQHHRNVMGRPVLRDYELTFACRSGAEAERQIALADLVLAVEGERIVLLSERLGREIAPRLSCAINWAHPESHPVLRLLGALQQQNTVDRLRFEWGPLSSARFLPRVRHGRAVLSVARWRVPTVSLRQALAVSDMAAFRRVQQLRSELAWPRFVSIDDADAPLTIDLDNPICVTAALRIARSTEDLRISEILPTATESCVRGPEGRYAHELIVPFVKETTLHTDVASVAPPLPARERARIPGSDWLYAKIYAGVAISDRLLCEHLAPALRRALRSRAIDHWFFVRYDDGESHLRVRAHGPAKRIAAELLPSLADALQRPVTEGSVWRMQLDTYEREIERYGGLAALNIAERAFFLDSEAVVRILASHPSLAERRHRAIVGTDRLLAALGLDLAERATLVRAARDALAQELDTKASRRARGAYFRAEHAKIDGLLANKRPEATRWRGRFARRDAGLARAGRRLRSLDGEGELGTSLSAIFSSYIHMHNNRMFATDQRANELLVLDTLHRHYDSLVRR